MQLKQHEINDNRLLSTSKILLVTSVNSRIVPVKGAKSPSDLEMVP